MQYSYRARFVHQAFYYCLILEAISVKDYKATA